MSGHSKWSTIKRQKAITDARRSVVFSKYARLITIAARTGGGDPNMNIRLRFAIEQARSVNMPYENIDRAIKAGTGELRGSQAKEMVYEGFGPGQVSIIVEAVTDNPNRTAGDLRTLFQKHGGRLGSVNSVQWLFQRLGVIRIPLNQAPPDRDSFCLEAIDAGATDFRVGDEEIVLMTRPDSIFALEEWVRQQQIAGFESGLEPIPITPVSPRESEQQSLYQLLDTLDEHPDVTNVFTNEG